MAQNKEKLKKQGSIPVESLPPMPRAQAGTPLSNNIFAKSYHGKTGAQPINPTVIPAGFRVLSADNGVPTLMEGSFAQSKLPETADVTARSLEYLDGLKKAMRLQNPVNELEATDVTTDALGQTHVRFQQKYHQLKVWNGNVVVHEVGGKIAAMNGRWFPTPTLTDLTPTISATMVNTLVVENIQKIRPFQTLSEKNKKLIRGEQLRPELVIYHPNQEVSAEKLAWHITAYPNVMHRYEYFVDANTGAVLHSYNHTCDFHGGLHAAHGEKPTVKPPLDGATNVTLLDANGVTRNLGVYAVTIPRTGVSAGVYFADISRPMYSSTQSRMPDEPVGAIWSLNAFNTSPNSQSFNYDHIYGATAASFASIPIGVSAHYNAGQAYTYYKNTFNRNSINGKGGTVISMVNVTEDNGAGMDNAYWNGEAMFYGNGGQYFTPLAKALDVAGHEISHGVVQNTANLEYQGEAGAMNESFADIFGAMIDRDDWKMGEDVVVTRFYPTGALRDLSNPHNGGTRLGDNGWQPANMTEKYNGTQDNGGVHINSGITNYAFYLFANQAAVGKDKAEQVFYRALTTYLVARSNFKDLRASVEKSCADMYPGNAAVLTAAKNAFAQVGIVGGGDPGGTTYQQDLAVNPGDELLLYSAADSSKIYLSVPGASTYTISTTKHMSKPSVSDKGDEIVFVGMDGKIHYININWTTGSIGQEQTFSNWGSDWDNVVISKDGSKLAAVSQFSDTSIYIYSDNLQRWKKMKLYNPTYTQGVSNGNVLFADALDWDHEGEEVMYDAYNKLQGTSGRVISYWDIGFLKAWDNGMANYGTGGIEKLFSSLPANTSIANPTFSKNSPHIIAFDYIDKNYTPSDLQVWGANIETGVYDTIFANNALGYPSFSRLDDKVLFNFKNNGAYILGQKTLTANKIRGQGQATVLKSPAYWGTWFANGTRRLVETQEISPQMSVQVSPNPTYDKANLEFNSTISAKGIATVYNLMGQAILTRPLEIANGVNQIQIELTNQPAGQYFIRLNFGAKQNVLKITKL